AIIFSLFFFVDCCTSLPEGRLQSHLLKVRSAGCPGPRSRPLLGFMGEEPVHDGAPALFVLLEI
ncbi:MAG: hypothetical protein IJR36_06040, partial [Lachnospiraceae bacterium]|nr:hypothetical protein [Lachnospiraceae bacterium]